MLTKSSPQIISCSQGPRTLRRRLEVIQHLFPRFEGGLSSDLLVRGSPDWGPGNLPEKRLRVGVIGTRKPSRYGLRFVAELITALKDLPLTFISGGALGIDGELHYRALLNGCPTEAWVVGPCAQPSPRSHSELFLEMGRRDHCAVVVPRELEPVNRQPHPSDWLKRNQWLSMGLDVLIVVEAGIYSGTWATVKFSQNLGIPIFALPGTIFSPESKGTNLMISTGYAHPVEGVGFLYQELVALISSTLYNGSSWGADRVVPRALVAPGDASGGVLSL